MDTNQSTTDNPAPVPDHLPTAKAGWGWLIVFALVYLLATVAYFIGYGIYIGVTQPGLDPAEVEQLIGNHATSLGGLAAMYVVQVICVMPVVWAAAKFPTQSVRDTLAIYPLPWRTLGFWLLIWAVYQAGALFVHTFVDVPEDAFVAQMRGSKHLALSLVVVLLAPLLEETIFRGYLFKAWRHSRLGLSGTLLITSAVFLLLHMGQYNALVLVQLFVFALILGMAREKTGSLLAPLTLHGVNNLFATILVTYMGVGS